MKQPTPVKAENCQCDNDNLVILGMFEVCLPCTKARHKKFLKSTERSN